MMEAANLGIPLFPSPPLHYDHHHYPYQVLQPIAASYCRDPMRNHLVPSSHRIILPVPGIINQVWHRNLEFEFMKIKNLLFCPSDPDDRCFLASIDTEFPGVLSASDLGRLQDPHYNYGKMKENVNATNIIQLGLTLSDRFGNFYAWEFNFSDFDIETDDQNVDSIKLLKTHGIDFLRNKKDGIPSSAFAKLCRRSGLVGNNSSKIPLTWVGFQSSYDFGFFTKILTGEKLPDDLEGFMSNVKMFFGPSVFDIKHMNARLRAGVYGGLETVAKTLGVAREAGRSHTAGSDSLLTLQTFIKLVHKHVCSETTDYRISSIETLRKLTMHSHVKSRAPFDIGLALLITNEERDQKDTYFKLYSCQGALYGFAT